MEECVLKAYAKINLTLDVVGKRDNGYHEVKMIMQQIDLYDEVTLKKSVNGIKIDVNSPFVPKDRRNIAYKAAEIMIERFNLSSGLEIRINKKIPVAAGLAGGSTDAAAVIKGINHMFNLQLKNEQMMEIGLELGADVPFCIAGGAAFAEGIGEKLTLIDGLRDTWMVLSKPNIGVSTKEIYEKLKWDQVKVHPNTDEMLKALRNNDNYTVASGLCNVLEEVTIDLYPVVGELKDMLREYGATGILMSGSGPSVFAMFRSYDKAKKAHKKVSRIFKQTYLVNTINL